MVDNQVVTVGMNNTQTRDIRAVLDRLTLCEHRAQRHKHFAGYFRIPHVPAAQHAIMDELSALSGRERPENLNLSFRLLLRDRASCPNRALAAERKDALKSDGRASGQAQFCATRPRLQRRRSGPQRGSSRDSWP